MRLAFIILAVGWALPFVFAGGVLVGDLLASRKRRRRLSRLAVIEAEAILEVADEVRRTSPPISVEFLAEVVAEAWGRQNGDDL